MTITPSLNPSLGSRFIKELKELIYLAGPILGAQLASTGMGFIDTSMSGQYSAMDLAAVALGTSIWIPAYLLVKGALMAVTPTVAQLFGARKSDQIASPVRQAMWMSLLLSAAIVLFMLTPEPLMNFLQLDPSMTGITADYLQAVSWGIPAYCLYNVLTSYCEGRSITKPAMLISIAGLLINIPLNYVLIYGKFGFPELGGVGCGYATAVCFIVMTIMMFCYVHFDERHKAIGMFRTLELPDLNAIKDLLRLGIPMGLGIFFEASIFSAVALVIGKLGAITVAGHQIALNFASMAFMVPLSLSIGITIRVGQAIGAGDMKAARFSSFSGIAATLITATVSAAGMLMFAEQIASIYTSDTAVLTLAAELLFFAAVFQYADGVQVAANGALRGYKDTKIPMVIIFIACWGIALPLGYTLGLTDLITEPMGPHGLWIGLVIALTISAVFLTLRLKILSERKIVHQNEELVQTTA
ncbi:MATE family efflux transporter [Endozoicomonas sp. OPT23]|uniref:MATE family efflux transporter n=1 Tax=Endozoicomonas sp. OPT23 TaxID=2072845 RepID=UPI00129AA3E1|nr:MATE family efflux transporter [Endozoicomonas sp. OPT23]MRI33019.1 MATE family efflux transporter [Endozoicomonas sp. OPT23]